MPIPDDFACACRLPCFRTELPSRAKLRPSPTSLTIFDRPRLTASPAPRRAFVLDCSRFGCALRLKMSNLRSCCLVRESPPAGKWYVCPGRVVVATPPILCVTLVWTMAMSLRWVFGCPERRLPTSAAYQWRWTPLSAAEWRSKVLRVAVTPRRRARTYLRSACGRLIFVARLARSLAMPCFA